MQIETPAPRLAAGTLAELFALDAERLSRVALPDPRFVVLRRGPFAFGLRFVAPGRNLPDAFGTVTTAMDQFGDVRLGYLEADAATIVACRAPVTLGDVFPFPFEADDLLRQSLTRFTPGRNGFVALRPWIPVQDAEADNGTLAARILRRAQAGVGSARHHRWLPALRHRPERLTA